jgi:hypothetical protein
MTTSRFEVWWTARLLEKLVATAKAREEPSFRWAADMYMLVRNGVLDDCVNDLVGKARAIEAELIDRAIAADMRRCPECGSKPDELHKLECSHRQP